MHTYAELCITAHSIKSKVAVLSHVASSKKFWGIAFYLHGLNYSVGHAGPKISIFLHCQIVIRAAKHVKILHFYNGIEMLLLHSEVSGLIQQPRDNSTNLGTLLFQYLLSEMFYSFMWRIMGHWLNLLILTLPNFDLSLPNLA